MSLFYSTCFWYLGIGFFIAKWLRAEPQNPYFQLEGELFHYKNPPVCHILEKISFRRGLPEEVHVERQEAAHLLARWAQKKLRSVACTFHIMAMAMNTTLPLNHCGGGTSYLHNDTKYFLPRQTSTSPGFLPAPLARGIHACDWKVKGKQVLSQGNNQISSPVWTPTAPPAITQQTRDRLEKCKLLHAS